MSILNEILKEMLSKADEFYKNEEFLQARVVYELITEILEEDRNEIENVNQKSIVYIRLAIIYLKDKKSEESLKIYQVFIKGEEEEKTSESVKSKSLTMEVLNELEVLGSTYMFYGKYDVAEEIYRYVLNMKEEFYHDHTGEILKSKYNLGVLLRKRGRFTEARSLLEYVFNKREKTLGIEDSETLETKRALGDLLCDEREYPEARKIYKETLRIQEELLEESNPALLETRNNIALTSYQLGNFNEAESIYKDVRDKRIKLLGEEDSATLTTRNALALMYIEAKKLDLAEQICTDVIEKRERLFGEKHPDTLSTLDNLALLYHYRSDFKKAEELSLSLIDERREVLGKRHPATLSAEKKLASVHRYQGQVEEAEDKLEKAEEILKKVLKARIEILGEDHLSTLTTKNTLGSINRQKGNYEEAEKIHKEILEKKIKKTGENSPGVFKILNDLGLLYLEMKKYKESKCIFYRALRVSEKIWEPENKNTVEILRDIGRVNEAEGNYEEAENYYRMALDRYKGTDASMLSTYNLLVSLFKRRKEENEAKDYLLKKRRILESQQFPDIEEIVNTNKGLSNIYIKQRDYESMARVCENRATRSQFSIKSFLDIAMFKAIITPILCFYGDNRSGKSVLMKILHACQKWTHRKLSPNDPEEKGYCRDAFMSQLILSNTDVDIYQRLDKDTKIHTFEISGESLDFFMDQLKEMIRFQIWSIPLYFTIGRGESLEEAWSRLVRENNQSVFTGKNNMFESTVTYKSNGELAVKLKTTFKLELIQSNENNRKIQLYVKIDSGDRLMFQLSEENQWQNQPTVNFLDDVYFISDLQFTTPKITRENLTKWILRILFDRTPFVFFRGSSCIFPAHRSGIALAMPHLKNFGQSTERYLSREDTDFLTYLRNYLSLGTRGLQNSENEIGEEIDAVFRKIQRERAQIVERTPGFESLEFSREINADQKRKEIRYKSGEVASSSLLLAPLDLYIQKLKSFTDKRTIQSAILNRNLDSVLVYEEPEQGLHPDSLHWFYKLVIKMYDVFARNELDFGLICTSHHPYFLEGILNEQIYAYGLLNISSHYQAVLFTLDDQGMTIGTALEIDGEGYNPNPFTDANVSLYNESAKWRTEYEDQNSDLDSQ